MGKHIRLKYYLVFFKDLKMHRILSVLVIMSVCQLGVKCDPIPNGNLTLKIDSGKYNGQAEVDISKNQVYVISEISDQIRKNANCCFRNAIKYENGQTWSEPPNTCQCKEGTIFCSLKD